MIGVQSAIVPERLHETVLLVRTRNVRPISEAEGAQKAEGEENHESKQHSQDPRARALQASRFDSLCLFRCETVANRQAEGHFKVSF